VVGLRLADWPLVADRGVPGTLSVQVGPVSPKIPAATVSVSLQPVITSVSPATGAPGTPSLSVRALGAGLGGATGVSFLRNNAPASSITVFTVSVSPHRTDVDLQIARPPRAPLRAPVSPSPVATR